MNYRIETEKNQVHRAVFEKSRRFPFIPFILCRFSLQKNAVARKKFA